MLNIVIVANDGYIQHAAVMLTSLFDSNNKEQFRIFLLTDSISDTNRIRLNKLCDAYNNKIEVHIPELELKQSCNIDITRLPSGSWSTMIYYKLFMPSILPADVNRCLFLDVDMVVVDDIKPLYEIDMEDNYTIAAVEDVLSCMPRKGVLGMEAEAPYINSGVMVCDIARWRKMEKERPIFNFVQEWSDRIINEQDVIAVYMTDRIKLLPIRWNMVSCNYLRQRFVFPKYYPELHEARKHPAIHHFCTFVQPWYADSPHPYKGLYRKYLIQYAEIAGFEPNHNFPYKGKPKSLYWKFRHSIGSILNFFDIIKQPGYILHPLRY